MAKTLLGRFKSKFGMSRGGFLGGNSAYAAASNSSETMAAFQPPQSSVDAEVLGSRDKITARARDLVRNNGWAAGAIAKEVDAVIGASFRPIMKPDWKALGLDEEWAKEFKTKVESRWRAYAEDPLKLADVTRCQTVPQMFALAYRTYLIEGEAIAIVNWKRHRATKTTLRIVDPDLLCNRDELPDSRTQRGGVRLNKDGVAVGYDFRQGHKNDGISLSDGSEYTWKLLPREKRSGRPVVLHFFDKTRDGQTRGMSRLAPIIEKLKQEDHYSKVELQAAVINAVLAAFIRSPMGPDAIGELLEDGSESLQHFAKMNESRNDHYGKNGINIGGARVTALYPNDEIGMVNTARPAAQFGDFESAVLRNIASGLNISYEQLASDWSKTNYSSARAALAEIWRGWTARRIAFAQGFCQLFFLAWMEEQIRDGHIELPAGSPEFLSHRFFYCRCKWVGPGRGFVDPVKEIQAAALRVSIGVSTLEDEAAELTGSDLAENLEQIRREIEDMPEGVLHPAQESMAKLLGHNGGPPMDDERSTVAKQ